MTSALNVSSGVLSLKRMMQNPPIAGTETLTSKSRIVPATAVAGTGQEAAADAVNVQLDPVVGGRLRHNKDGYFLDYRCQQDSG